MAAHDDVFNALGFTEAPEYADFVQQYANSADTDNGSLSANGAFVVKGAWSKGDVWVYLERNQAPESGGAGDEDLESLTTHPPVFVINKGDQRLVTVMQRDPEALKAVLSDLG